MMWIHRRRMLHLGFGLGGMALLSHAPAVLASERTYRIFMVLGRGEGANETAFKDYLARRGMKVEYFIRNTGGDTTKLPDILDEIKQARPDLVYSWGTPQTRALVGDYNSAEPERFLRDIPIVFTFVAAPLDAKIVSNLEKPGGNVTGTIHIAPVVAQVNTILAYRPISRLGVVYNPAERNSLLAVESLRSEWRKRGLTLIEQPVPLNDGQPSQESIPDAITRCKEAGAQMLYVGPDTFIATTHSGLVADTALKLKLPTFSVTERIVRTDSALLALSSSSYGIGRLTGIKAAQILLEGKRPGDIPVETLRRFSVVINMTTAKTLSHYPPIDLLNIAEVVGI
jgi:putative ABC transport system substrate-binding protein